MKQNVYIETTVVSYLTAKPSRDIVIAGHQEATRELWSKLPERHQPYVSALVVQEAGRGDPTQAQMRLTAIAKFPMIAIDDEARVLAEKIIAKKGVPVEYPEDALHIAVAAVNGMEIILTWNFAHLNNPFTRKKVRKIVEAEGYSCPEVCSPEELLEVER